jgi:HEPN domain-containing protein
MSEDPAKGGSHYPADEWVHKAHGDLDVARRIAGFTSPNHDAVAFHAQQAVEKLIKAAIAASGREPPKVHDLPELLRRLNAAGMDWTWPMTELRTLTMSAVHARYPGFDVSPECAAEALSIAERVWASLLPRI